METIFSLREIIETTLGKVCRETTPYVYWLMDTITGKQYIGCRTAKGCHPNELGVKYFTSSKIVKPIFKERPSRFRKNILYIGLDALEKEIHFLHLMKAKDCEWFYNIHNGDTSFNPKKAAEVTVLKKIGVHSRSKEQMSIDSNKMVSIHKKANTGIFTPGAAEKGRDTQRKLGLAAFNKDNQSRGGKTSGNAAKLNKTGIHAFTKEQRIEASKKSHDSRFKCNVCGLEGAACSVALHQKASKHSGRTKLQDNR